MSNEHIHFLIAGGTIDNVCYDLDRTNSKSGIESFLCGVIKPEFSFTTEVVFMKDSRDLTTADRRIVLQRLCDSNYNHNVVTHGTYTMVDTAKFLEEHMSEFKDKTVVITGAMVPLGDDKSDAAFNLGFAVHASLSASPGVYIAMSGRLWDPKEVRKDMNAGRFSTV